MKVVFVTGVEAPITNVSSIYCLQINSKASDKIEEFKEMLTDENLKSFALINDQGEEVDSAENFTLSHIDDRDVEIDQNNNTTNFILRPMTDVEKKIAEMLQDEEIQAEAIEELASIIAEI